MIMKMLAIGREFWNDEAGAVVSAELVMVGALGVLGGTVGIETLSKSINEELSDVAFAIRSFDQSFSVKRQQSAGAYRATSRFEQLDVKTAHEQLRQHKADIEDRQKKQLESQKKDRAEAEQPERSLAM